MADHEIELGLASNNLIALRSLGVPPPDQVYLEPCSAEQQCGDGSWQRAGWQTLVMQWDTLHEAEACSLLTHLFTTEEQASATVYVRAPKRNAWRRGCRDVRLFETEVKRPNLAGDDGQPIERFSTAYDGLTLRFTLLAEITPGSLSWSVAP